MTLFLGDRKESTIHRKKRGEVSASVRDRRTDDRGRRKHIYRERETERGGSREKEKEGRRRSFKVEIQDSLLALTAYVHWARAGRVV